MVKCDICKGEWDRLAKCDRCNLVFCTNCAIDSGWGWAQCPKCKENTHGTTS